MSVAINPLFGQPERDGLLNPNPTTFEWEQGGWWQVLERGCRIWLTPPPFDGWTKREAQLLSPYL